MLYPNNCGWYVQLLEQFLLLHDLRFSYMCVYCSLSKKNGEIPLMQLFKKGTESYSCGTQLLTLKFTSWFLLHFNWETVWELFIFFWEGKGQCLHLLKVKFANSSAWEILLKAVLWPGRVLHHPSHQNYDGKSKGCTQTGTWASDRYLRLVFTWTVVKDLSYFQVVLEWKYWLSL